ncbi:MAG: SRPBCC family protein [Acidimicrobiia bacterium]
MSVSVDIKATIDEVWEAAADLASHGRWMADVESIEFDSEIRQGAGTVMRVATRVGPFRTNDMMRVTAWEPGSRISVEHRGLFTGRGEFQLSAVGGATRFTWSEDIAFPWRFGGPIGATLARPILTMIWRGNIRRLKALLEG